MKKKKLPKEPARPPRYQIVDALHDSWMEFAIYDDDDDKEPLLTGTIKWDNCSNWDVPQMHFCSLEDMQEFHRAIERCYEIASKEMKHWLTDEIVASWS